MRRSAKYRALKILKKMDIFVKNLPFEITEQEINEAFARYGEVSGVKMLFDKESGRFRGMAFVTMQNFSEAQAAIDSLNGADLGGRPMRVEVSRPREQRITGFGGGFSREKRSFGFKRRNFDRGAADGGDAGNTQEPEGEGRFKPRKKFGWRPHEKRGFGDGEKPFNRKKGGFKKRPYDGDFERQNRRPRDYRGESDFEE